MLDRVVNRDPFSYDKNNDPQWAAYSKQYRREGDRARANTLAQASAATGGRPSSFAMTAASQAGDYYAAKLSDKLPELYRQAYERYMNEFQMNRQALGDVNAMANRHHDQWQQTTGFDQRIHDNHISALRDNQVMQQRQHQWDVSQRQAPQVSGGGYSAATNTLAEDDIIRRMLSFRDDEAALRWLLSQEIGNSDAGALFELYRRVK
jgi:hypothetical protein